LSGNGIELDIILEGFLESRRGLTPGTVKFYREKLVVFIEWCKGVKIKTVEEITPSTIRDFFAELEERGATDGGRHAYYRSIKAMLHWYEDETEYEYRSPMKRVEPPSNKIDPIPGVTAEEIQKLIDACHGENEKRDRAVFQVLFDTGARASELLALNIEDINFVTGAVTIQHGKGDKKRTVFVGTTAKKALRAYLKDREDLQPFDPVFVKEDGMRMTYEALRQVIRRRAENARLEGTPYPHDFRRAFAITLWRNGVDIVTISRLMGHSSLEVLKRYLAQDTNDLARAHAKASPVDTKLK
jgi:site-specific recombinase XerD